LIRLIEKAVYDGDPEDVSLLLATATSVLYINFVCSLFTLIHRAYILRTVYATWIEAKGLFEEVMDWFDPLCE
jgi:hypothetical protein